MDISSEYEDDDFQLAFSDQSFSSPKSKDCASSTKVNISDKELHDSPKAFLNGSSNEKINYANSKAPNFVDEDSRDSLLSLRGGLEDMDITLKDCHSRQESDAHGGFSAPEDDSRHSDPEDIDGLSESQNSQNDLESEDNTKSSDSEASSFSNSNDENYNRLKSHQSKKELSRKRKRCETDWEKWKKKRAVNTGAEYKPTKLNRKIINARQVKKGCNCRSQCSSKLMRAARENCNIHFWNLGSSQKRWEYILRHIREKRLDSGMRKKQSRIFSLNGVRVCKVMFINTLGISGKVIDTALRKGRDENEAVMDLRGKTRRKDTPHLQDHAKKRESVIRHIKLFPKVGPHYCRKDSNKEYLSGDLNPYKMFQLYQDWAEQENLTAIASRWQYMEVFNNEFNISFHKPKKDLCNLCEEYKNSNTAQKVKLQAKYDEHITNKKKVRELKAMDSMISKSPGTDHVCVCCYDLQKMLPSPKAETNVLHYLSRFHTFNESIYDIGRHEGHCYVWPEHEARRGANETGSIMLDYMDRKRQPGITDFSLYCDNCPGQNKNKPLISMCVYASAKLKININRRFLETGHSQNEGDSIHAMIERKSHSQDIWTHDQWVEVIAETKSKKPYEVIEVQHPMIFDFKDLAKRFNWSENTRGNEISISKTREFYIRHDMEGYIFYKTSFDEPYETINIFQRKRKIGIANFPLKQAYDGLQNVNEAKLDRMLNLCEYHPTGASLLLRIIESTLQPTKKYSIAR